MGFFLTSPGSLFSCDIIPRENQNRSEKYNTLARIIILTTIIFTLFEWKYTLLFFAISMISIIVVYYSEEDNKKEKFNYVDKKNMQSTEFVNQAQFSLQNGVNGVNGGKNMMNGMNGNGGRNGLNDGSMGPLEKIRQFSNGSGCQGYPNFNKPLYIPVKLYDLDAAGGYDPLNVFGKMNYEPVRELYPESKDFPDMINPVGKKLPVQYLDEKYDNSNIVLSHGTLSRDQLRDLFKDNDRIIVNKSVEPANMPNCKEQYGILEREKHHNCHSCGTDYSAKEAWCPQCGMGSHSIDKNDAPQLQRVKTLPEWKNDNFKQARRQTGPIENHKENMTMLDPRRGGNGSNRNGKTMGEYSLDGVTFIHETEQDGCFDSESNYKPYADGGLGVDPNDSGKIINRTNPMMYYREGNLQESQYPELHEFDDFADEGIYVFNRLDPQAIRDQGLDPARMEEMPKRNQFSKRMGRFEAPTHTMPLDKISNNPEIDMYQLGYKSMKDCTGDIKYQVPEGVYQYPNFSKSKVDHILFLDPMYGVSGEERRVKTLQESRVIAENQWMSDSLNQRVDIMQSYLDKTSSRRAQQRIAPHSAARGYGKF